MSNLRSAPQRFLMIGRADSDPDRPKSVDGVDDIEDIAFPLGFTYKPMSPAVAG